MSIEVVRRINPESRSSISITTAITSSEKRSVIVGISGVLLEPRNVREKTFSEDAPLNFMRLAVKRARRPSRCLAAPEHASTQCPGRVHLRSENGFKNQENQNPLKKANKLDKADTSSVLSKKSV